MMPSSDSLETGAGSSNSLPSGAQFVFQGPSLLSGTWTLKKRGSAYRTSVEMIEKYYAAHIKPGSMPSS